MKKKTKNIKIFLTVIALLILIFIVREKYYEMKLSMQKENNLNDAQISNQNINNTNNINDINNTYNLGWGTSNSRGNYTSWRFNGNNGIFNTSYNVIFNDFYDICNVA